MAWVFYWQKTPESAWELADSKNRSKIIADKSPPFVTILDLNTEIEDEMSREQLGDVHYRGPLYFDFDSDSIEEVIPQFQKFLSKLTEIEIDLRQVELYASGGKGFHVIVPMEIFVQKPSTAGYTFLPQVYKEIAQEFYVDCLDMRVYSARKGRMFRVANVERTNGRFKVPLSVEEARTITVDKYAELTSAPRQSFVVEAPTFNDSLALTFTKSRDKVKKAVAARRNSKSDEKLIATFNGDFPSSVKLLGSGIVTREGVGFQKLATQLAITAHALGQSEEQLLAICEGVIQNHKGDGSRYGTAQKRQKELRRMYHYMHDNPCYEFSAGGIKACLAVGTPTQDLNQHIEDETGVLEDDEELEINDAISKGVRFNKFGMHCKVYDKETKEHSLMKVSELGIDGVALLQDVGSGVIGYEYNSYVNGVYKGRRKVQMNTFNSANSVQIAMGGPESTTIQISDPQAKGMMDLMRKNAEKSKQIVTAVPREGLDIVQLPSTEDDEDRYEVIYASQGVGGVLSPMGNTYRLNTAYGSEGELRSDLLKAPALEDNEETRKFFDLFFTLHPKDVMSRTFGYYLACFLCQLLRKEFHQFPVLQVFGQSGAGKTSFNQLCTNLHYYKRLPPVWAANSVTPFVLQALLQSSASLPVLFDEFKTQELGPRRSQEFLMVVRNNYTNNSGGKGRVSRDAGASTLGITPSANAAPLVFMTEQKEAQTAVVDRSIEVSMEVKQEGLEGEEFLYCVKNRKILGQFGHIVVQHVLTTDLAKLNDDLMGFRRQLQGQITRPSTARPVYNNSVVLVGLDLGQKAMSAIFGTRYDETFEGLKNEILANIDKSLPINLSEPSKVMDALAAMSSLSENDHFRIVIGVDYLPATDPVTREACVEIHLRNAWDKYSRHKRAQGEQLLYASEAAFVIGLTRHRAAVDTVCAKSDLKGGKPSVKVVRYSLKTLYDEHVEEFKDLEKEALSKLFIA